jgi:predicted lipid-binding transport protein (Tim44 family)
MGDGFQLLDILIFAVIAGFLVIRLRSVLGRRTGNERPRDPAAPAPLGLGRAPIALPTRPRLAAVAGAELGDPALAPLAAADPGFDRAGFIAGARAAFEIIVTAFATGDVAALKPLLSPDVYSGFADAINARLQAKETLETKIVAIRGADIVESKVEGEMALVTVKFVSDQIIVVRGMNGAVLEGEPDQAAEKTDLWTFSRPVRAQDPNWTLIATHAPEK